MGIQPSEFREMEERVAKNRAKGWKEFVQHMPEHKLAYTAIPVILADMSAFNQHQFVYIGKPIGKPRMTRSDKWKKRPRVLAYRAFADGIRLAAGELMAMPDLVIVTAHVPMPESWPLKKKQLHRDQPCRQKPDWDNIGKAVCDALFEEDCCIWLGVTVKYWCVRGDERLNVQVLYAKPK